MDFLTPEEKASVPKTDCGLGHACQFCPKESSCTLDKPYHNKVLIERRLQEIGQIIVVLANKGGVGKSTVSANLAAGLARNGFRVGVADADIHGPNQSRFFGFSGAKIRTTKAGLQTHGFVADGNAHPVEVGSLAFMLEDDTTPIVWRDAYKHDFIHHLIGSFDWGSLDFLVVDMPPGTGNELITLCDMLEGSNVSAVLVTSPQAVAQMDSLKAGRFCRERGLPVIGAVVNMAGVQCPHCHEEFHLFPDAGIGEALAKLDIDKIAEIPLSPELALGSDRGEPIVTALPDSAVARAFDPMIDAVSALGRAGFHQAVAATMKDVFAENLNDADLKEALAALPAGAVGADLSELLNQEASRLKQASQPVKERG
ncbi:Chromosome partitioning ATPase, Mrp family, contains Fe-S cluster [Salipiger thiooxidans]|uniref:Iron-sulfur cluster carrier protein n=1 Tax=Salipiger thiooxidans TaxID=282683 RepID=A0A1G7EFW8_9RHOB|nr:P-loop NTPase [Salipiger thiooxidans]SDE62532.1 Chromosome partitioning ATPase, Mrp family, contains Fe-S cluster [Salipiger thiooxidans]